MRMGENLHMNIESIPTGALALDMALGIGGCPAVASSSSTARVLGKSTLAMHVVAEASETVASVPTSTPSTRWTRLCAPSASTSMTSSSPSRHRRAGPRDHRHADPLGCT